MALTLLRIFAIITMVVLGLLPLHALASPICTFTHSTIQLSYRGTPIAVDIYQPRRTIRPPVLFLIHGSAGLFTKPANSTTDTLDNFGEHTFARACFLVVLPHYLDALHLRSLDSPDQARTHFPDMLAALQSIYHQVEARFQLTAHPRSIGIYGESLGGFLAIALAADEPRISALSEFSAGLPPFPLSDLAAPHHVLIQHAADDTLVPVQQASDLAAYYQNRSPHIDLHLVIYPGQTHYFDGATRARILARSLDFFNNSLQPARSR